VGGASSPLRFPWAQRPPNWYDSLFGLTRRIAEDLSLLIDADLVPPVLTVLRKSNLADRTMERTIPLRY